MTYEKWRERLGQANDPELFPLEHQDRLIASGEGQYWGCGTAAMITQVVPYPSGARVCKVYAAAGDMTAMMECLKPAVEAWAKAQGCTHTMIEGRDGWRRKHPDYRHHQTILIKDLG